jgi:hypothetical protein
LTWKEGTHALFTHEIEIHMDFLAWSVAAMGAFHGLAGNITIPGAIPAAER